MVHDFNSTGHTTSGVILGHENDVDGARESI